MRVSCVDGHVRMYANVCVYVNESVVCLYVNENCWLSCVHGHVCMYAC